MKKFVLSFLLVAAFGLFIKAQSLQVLNSWGDVVSGQTINIWDWDNADVNYIISVEFDIKNTSGTSKNIYCKRQEISIVPSTQNYFCWDVCYPPQVNQSSSGLYIAPNGINSLFVSDYKPMLQMGTSTIRYVWWDQANSNDSVWVTVNFNIGSAGINDNKPSGNLTNAYPNPANSTSNISYTLTNTNSGIIRVSNILGETVKEISITGSKGLTSLNVADLNSGIYFYSLITNDKVLATKKIIVSH